MAIERVNSRLRHWFARFRRRTCVVSKTLEMVDATIALFAAYHVNRTATKLTLPRLLNSFSQKDQTSFAVDNRRAATSNGSNPRLSGKFFARIYKILE